MTFLGANPTRIESTSLQKALAASWGKAATFEEFDGAPLVSLVNPLDVADYLGDTKVLGFLLMSMNLTKLAKKIVQDNRDKRKTQTVRLNFIKISLNLSVFF